MCIRDRRNEELPNGSKVGYGYGEEDEVTSITQSTEEGEENSNQKIYRDGEVIEVRSGDTVVKYSYDYKRRIKNIYVNGETPYESIEYTDDTTESGVSGKVDKAELTNAKGEKFMTVKDKSGRVVKTKYNLSLIHICKGRYRKRSFHGYFGRHVYRR